MNGILLQVMEFKIKRGNIYLVELNPVIGSEIGKIRPAIVISNDINNTYSDTISIIPITSSIGKIYPFEVFIPSNIFGLDKDSKAKISQIRTVDKKRVIKEIGVLTKELVKEVEKAVLIHLGIK